MKMVVGYCNRGGGTLSVPVARQMGLLRLRVIRSAGRGFRCAFPCLVLAGFADRKQTRVHDWRLAGQTKATHHSRAVIGIDQKRFHLSVATAEAIEAMTFGCELPPNRA